MILDSFNILPSDVTLKVLELQNNNKGLSNDDRISGTYGIDKTKFLQTGTGAVIRNGLDKQRNSIYKDFGTDGTTPIYANASIQVLGTYNK